MKERFGKLLGVLVCSMVLVGTLAVAAFADDDVVPVGSADVAWIGETGYETLEGGADVFLDRLNPCNFCNRQANLFSQDSGSM